MNKTKEKEVPQIGDKNFESLRENKTKLPPPSKREYQIARFNIAVNMIRCFRYRPWMSWPDVIGENGERINNQGKIFTPKFQRKTQ